MNLSRRRFLFTAPALIPAPRLMKLSALVFRPSFVPDFMTDTLRYTAVERYRDSYGSYRTVERQQAMQIGLFRALIEPGLREFFDRQYMDFSNVYAEDTHAAAVYRGERIELSIGPPEGDGRRNSLELDRGSHARLPGDG